MFIIRFNDDIYSDDIIRDTMMYISKSSLFLNGGFFGIESITVFRAVLLIYLVISREKLLKVESRCYLHKLDDRCPKISIILL